MVDNARFVVSVNRDNMHQNGGVRALLIESRRLIDLAIDDCLRDRKEVSTRLAHTAPLPAVRSDDLAAQFRRISNEALLAISTPLRLGPCDQSEWRLVSELVGAGKRVHLLYSHSYAAGRDLVEMSDYAKGRLSIRIVDADFSNMAVIDRKSAIVWADLPESPNCAAIITNPQMMLIIYQFARTLWVSGKEAYPIPEFQTEEFDDNSIAVIRALSRGLKDEAAAKTLSVSLRTYRRYVADLMHRLGAISRFQFGVRAAESGLLDWVGED